MTVQYEVLRKDYDFGRQILRIRFYIMSVHSLKYSVDLCSLVLKSSPKDA